MAARCHFPTRCSFSWSGEVNCFLHILQKLIFRSMVTATWWSCDSMWLLNPSMSVLCTRQMRHQKGRFSDDDGW